MAPDSDSLMVMARRLRAIIDERSGDMPIDLCGELASMAVTLQRAAREYDRHGARRLFAALSDGHRDMLSMGVVPNAVLCALRESTPTARRTLLGDLLELASERVPC